MCIEFRSLVPGEEDKAVDFIEKGYGFQPMPHFRWKLMDNPLWKYDYSRISEYNGKIVAAAFFEPVSMKFFSRAITVMVAGAGAVHPDFRKRGYYTKMTVSALEMARHLGKTMFVAYVVEREIAYPALKTMGFYHLFSQRKYVKILNVKKTFVIAAERLNKTKFFKNVSLSIRMVPDSEEPFLVRLKKGVLTVEKDSNDCDLVVSGDLKKVITLVVSNTYKEIIPLVLTGKVTVKCRLRSLVKIFRVINDVVT